MKKILLSLFTVLFAAPSFAQYSSGGFSLDQSSVYYGIRLGMNIANLSGDAPDLGSKLGLNLGGTVGLRLSDTTPVFLESGLYFTSFGASKDKSSITLNYLELPILIKYGVQVSDDIALAQHSVMVSSVVTGRPAVKVRPVPLATTSSNVPTWASNWVAALSTTNCIWNLATSLASQISPTGRCPTATMPLPTTALFS